MCLYDGIRRHSSAGQSARFTSVRSGVRSPLSPPKERLQTKRFAVFYLFCKLREGSEPHRRCCGGLPSGRAATDKECERFAKQTNEAKLRSPLSLPYWNASIDTILAFLFFFCQKWLGTRIFSTFANKIYFIVSKSNTQKSKRSDLNLHVFHPFKSQ